MGPARGYQSRVLGKTRLQELKSPPCGGQAQMKAGTAAQGIGSLGARREGGGSCCMIEFMRQQRASPCLTSQQKEKYRHLCHWVPFPGKQALVERSSPSRGEIPLPRSARRLGASLLGCLGSGVYCTRIRPGGIAGTTHLGCVLPCSTKAVSTMKNNVRSPPMPLCPHSRI